MTYYALIHLLKNDAGFVRIGRLRVVRSSTNRTKKNNGQRLRTKLIDLVNLESVKNGRLKIALTVLKYS